MESEGDEEYEPLPACSCNSFSTRRKPHSASNIPSPNWVHMGIVRIVYVCSIWISRWCSIELHGRRLAVCSRLQRGFLTRASQYKGKGQSQCPENGTCEEAKGRRGNKCWNWDTVQDAARNEHLAGLYQPRESCFQGVECHLQLTEDPLDVSLGQNDSLTRSLVIVFCREAWTSISNEPQGWLERFQSHSQLPATSNHLPASHSLLRNQRAQCPCPRSASRKQGCHLQSPPCRCWSGCPPELPVICKARIHGTPKPPWWKASWCYEQRHQSISWQYARRNAPCDNIQWHTGA